MIGSGHVDPRLLAVLPARPELLVLDFDGVMTDNAVYVGEDGRESVRCSRGDGMGISLLRKAGLSVLVLSTETNPVVQARCRKLGIECINGLEDKEAIFRRILMERSIASANTIYVGNDVNDIGCLRLAGCALVVADAHPAVLEVADYVLSRPGGQGAVREVCDALIAHLRWNAQKAA
ncbi:MAG: HAD hydrolase family protein [Gemmatales bacterium]|nr:HAD hydrolase family protein [Gemmatales bacterium]MDW8385623.1 HAD hydrolase family protein [Gemmatales bacterium]